MKSSDRARSRSPQSPRVAVNASSDAPRFQQKPLARAIGLAALMMAASTGVQAGAGFGDAYAAKDKAPFIIPTFFASSPAGERLWVDANGNLAPVGGAPGAYDPKNQAAYSAAVSALFGNAPYPGTGKALRKFVDKLPLPGKNNSALGKMADGTEKYIPVAVPSKWRNPEGLLTNDDYFEIAVVEYKDKFHSDLGFSIDPTSTNRANFKPKTGYSGTTLRGYVQIDHEASNGRTPLPGSISYPLTYPDGTAIMIYATDANGKVDLTRKVQALAVDQPRYLGPTLTATKDVPTRVKLLNLLPVGRAVSTATTRKEWVNGAWTNVADRSISDRKGDLFLPLDPSYAGSGLGPDGETMYTHNRVMMHLHGGDNPWISDGTPHQWITPVDEANPMLAGTVAAELSAKMRQDLIPDFTRGVGAINVPDMNDPGPGAMTYYYPNGQTARMEWFHDHTYGITRLNVYAGIASVFMLTDAVEQKLINDRILPGPDATIPLIIQDKTFVPDDIALQDARWNTSAWGKPGDLWYPHVYETVQDPNQDTNFNSVGRWHWGPWFWPVFPSMYELPSGAYNDVTGTPEAWMDTPVINGVAYPTLTVEPKPYRFRILNASNDRSFTFNLFIADDTVVTDDGRTNTEMKMVPVNSWTNTLCADPAATRSDGICTPQNWSTDVYGHNGGVPDATTQGPSIVQIANEGGWLPGVAIKDPMPLNFLLDKGRAAVLNVDWSATGLHLGNGERADVIIDFSAYAGKTLLVYNDTGAPVPAADPRNEYFTGYGDNSATGGAEDTRPGYGPNSRTMMQIVVSPTIVGTAPTATDVATIDTAIKQAFVDRNDRPVVAQSAYNAALGTKWDDAKAFAHIYTGSLKEPAFKFVPGDPSFFNSIVVSNAGSGYIRPPAVTITAAPAGGVTAEAEASLKIDKLHIIDPGRGYRVAPVVSITSNSKGNGAMATATLKVRDVHITNGGSGYAGGNLTHINVTSGGDYTGGISSVTLTNAGVNAYPGGGGGGGTPSVTLSAPTTPGGRQATARAVMGFVGGARRVTAIQIVDPGSGYTTTPTVTIANPAAGGTLATATAAAPTVIAPTVTITGGGGAGATAQAVMSGNTVSAVNILTQGSGYTTTPTITFSGGSVVTAATANTTPANVSALPTVVFAAPPAGGTRATGNVVINAAGQITGVTITNPGSGYSTMPSMRFTGGTGTGAAGQAYGSLDQLTLDIPDPTNPDTAGGAGYDDLSTIDSEPNNLTPGLRITLTAPPPPPAGATFQAVAPLTGASGKVFDITLTKSGQGYRNQPTITIGAPVMVQGTTGGRNPRPIPNILQTAPTAPLAVLRSAAARTDTANNGVAQGSIAVKSKAIQELFDPTYGRLNATFGVELPYTSALTQTTIPLGYADPVTEVFQDGETQIWKITHNGVDTHPIHFHLLNVQLINRVGWDNFITPPEPNELGWKEVIKMSPLEDVIVAVRAKRPKLGGFGVPLSIRRQDPSQEEGVTSGFTQIDPNTGLPATMTNNLVNYGWEYVWHCHILGHEENDFMRPVKFLANEPTPTQPTNVVAGDLGNGQVRVSWTDTSSSEIYFSVRRRPVASGANGAWTVVGQALANASRFDDTVPVGTTASAYQYDVVAVGAAGNAASGAATPVPVPAAPTDLTFTRGSAPVVLSWHDASANENGWHIWRDDGVSGLQLIGTQATTTGAQSGANVVVSYTDNSALPNTAYTYNVTAYNAGGDSRPSNSVSVAALPSNVSAPTAVSATALTETSVQVSFTDTTLVETGFQIQRALVTGGVTGAFANLALIPASNGSGSVITYTDSGLVTGQTYAYRVVALSATFATAAVAAPAAISAEARATPTPLAPAAPSALTAAARTTSATVVLSWKDNSTNESSFAILRSADSGVTWAQVGTVGSAAASGTTVTYSDKTATGAAYRYKVTAVNASGSSVDSNVIDVAALAAPATPSSLTASVRTTIANVALSWIDNSTTETGFIVYRSTDNTNFVQLATVNSTTGAATGTTYTYSDLTALASVTYYYYVVATGGGGNSAPTATASSAALVAPPAPTLFTVAPASATSVSLAWVDASTNETGFIVQRAVVTGGVVGAYSNIYTSVASALTATATGGVNTYTDTGLSGTTRYAYRVVAVNVPYPITAPGATSSTPVLQVTPAAPVPATPTGLTAAARTTSATVALSWTDASNNETSFQVQRSLDGLTYTNLGTVARTGATVAATAGTVTYNDTTAAAGTSYWYQVLAVNASGSSQASNAVQVAAVPVPAAPVNVIVTKVAGSTTQVTVTYTDAAINESGFVVQMATVVNGVVGAFTTQNGATVAVTGAAVAGTGTTRTATITRLTAGTTYAFRVVATNALYPVTGNTLSSATSASAVVQITR